MFLPTVQGTIRRRLLVNFRVDPDVMAALLPAPFTPKIQAGTAIAGICLIRLEGIRPRHVPESLGLASENAAHRVAVRWNEGAEPREGVFIPRRDTGSHLNHLAGGRVFPGEHHFADFDVSEADDALSISMSSRDGSASLSVRGRVADTLPASSCFASIEEASRFFETGSVGFSVTRKPGELQGLELRTKSWRVEPFAVDDVRSSYFEDVNLFPPGSVVFDHALLMRDVAHEWHAVDDLFVEPRREEAR